ncbi:DoxX family protein [Streptomyces sp. NPDC047079]|uniref:DoxX family protein n=1 Tax=Streptomyces sp. NPDC047079 TaxID=3154607 RepID=UPI003408DAE7
METRTRRTPTGERSSGFDDTPVLSMMKVPSDPAQVIVNHASFRVQLGASTRRDQSPYAARQLSTPLVGTADSTGALGAAAGRRRPVVWSGKSAPGDTGAHRLLQAVRSQSVGHGEEPAGAAGATQVISRLGVHDLDGTHGYDDGLGARTLQAPVVGGAHGHDSGGTRLLPHMRSASSVYGEDVLEEPLDGGPAFDEPPYDERAYDEPAYGGPGYGEHPYGRPLFRDEVGTGEPEPRGRRHGGTPASSAAAAGVRHAYYPGRRMNLGVVLLPLRIFLGSISAYAGMGKLCDPVYFDGGKRGSMVTWLSTLHPWEAAEPLRQFALQHPVGTGLVIAFLQVIVGVLTVLGLWQRVAAAVGAMLSAALIVTVSWRTVPAYDAPDIIYLAAWSPLIIAGAPVYSVDGRLAGGAWRRLGPRADIWELRRYVLRRGALMTALVTGVTLLVGSLLGGAVRDADRVVVPGPGQAPRNELPGSPLPGTDGGRPDKSGPSASRPSATHGTTSSSPSSTATEPGAAGATGTVTGGRPSQTQGTAGQAPPRHSAPTRQAPSTSAGPSSSGGSGTGGPTGGASGGAGGSSSSGGSDHLVGGLLG